MVTLGRGVDPSPQLTRPQQPSAAEAENAAKEAAAFSATEAEVAGVARQAATEKAASEAKITQDAAAAATIIVEEAEADGALYTNPAARVQTKRNLNRTKSCVENIRFERNLNRIFPFPKSSNFRFNTRLFCRNV